MRDFYHCLEDCGLEDLGFVGNPFTWTNKQAGANNIQERLDRGVANSLWWSKFPQVRVTHLTRVLSDHCPILVDWAGRKKTGGLEKRVKLFRFEDMWLQEADCTKVIRNAWGTTDLMFNISRCRGALSAWSKIHFGNLPKEIDKCKKSWTDYKLTLKQMKLCRRVVLLRIGLQPFCVRRRCFGFRDQGSAG